MSYLNEIAWEETLKPYYLCQKLCLWGVYRRVVGLLGGMDYGVATGDKCDQNDAVKLTDIYILYINI